MPTAEPVTYTIPGRITGYSLIFCTVAVVSLAMVTSNITSLSQTVMEPGALVWISKVLRLRGPPGSEYQQEEDRYNDLVQRNYGVGMPHDVN